MLKKLRFKLCCFFATEDQRELIKSYEESTEILVNYMKKEPYFSLAREIVLLDTCKKLKERKNDEKPNRRLRLL